MASLQSDKARSGSFLAHHHPHRLLNAAARFGVVALGSSSTRPPAAMPSSALLISPINLQCSRSPWLSARSVVESANDVAKAARSTEKRIFPPRRNQRFNLIRLPTLAGGRRATGLQRKSGVQG